MPCMCYYDPPEESKKYIKQRCVEIVDEIKRLEKSGDLLEFSLSDTHELINHLYNPKFCKENK